MNLLPNILIIIFYVSFVSTILLTLFIILSFLFIKKINKYIIKEIKEDRKEVLKLYLQDLSLYVQLLLTIGLALLLYSLSLEGLNKVGCGLMGLGCLTAGNFIFIWRYLPIKTKLFGKYKN